MEWIRQRKKTLVSLFALQVICYAYFFTVPLLSNHTFPNVWLYNYPSFKTSSEGRWFADLVILFQGSSGVQSFQFVCAVMLQAVNGLLFADLLRIRETRARFFLAGVLCLYPSFLDYYCFACDHITFVLGDTLCLIAALFWMRSVNKVSRIAVPALLYVLSMAAYGPKIALVLFLSIGALILRLQQIRDTSNLRILLGELISNIITVFLAVLALWITLKITVTFDGGPRSHINSVQEIISGIKMAYNSAIAYYSNGVGGFPAKIEWLPAGVIFLGCIYLVLNATKKGFACLGLTLVMLLLIPLILQSPWIINNLSPANVARIGAVFGYAIVFFIAIVMRLVRPGWIGESLAAIFLYFFILLATQQNNAACFKSIYEGNIINRIVERCDTVFQPWGGMDVPVVIIGEYPPFEVGKYVKYPPQHWIHEISTPTFAPYRQVEILNFFEGKQIFRKPTSEEVKTALESAVGRIPWPSPNSVFMARGIMIVLLQPSVPGVKTTWDQMKMN